jgi:hypothetical protein
MPWSVEKIIRVCSATRRSWQDVMSTVQALEKAAVQGNTDGIYSGLVELIPEFHPISVRAPAGNVVRAI